MLIRQEKNYPNVTPKVFEKNSWMETPMRPLRDPVRLAKPTPTPLDMGIDICAWSYAIDIDIGSETIDYKRYGLPT